MLTRKKKPLDPRISLQIMKKQKNHIQASKTCASTNFYTSQVDSRSIPFVGSPMRYKQNFYGLNNHLDNVSESKSLKRSHVHDLKKDIKIVLSQCCEHQYEPDDQELEKCIKEQQKINYGLKTQICQMKKIHNRRINVVNKQITCIEQQYNQYERKLEKMAKEINKMGL